MANIVPDNSPGTQRRTLPGAVELYSNICSTWGMDHEAARRLAARYARRAEPIGLTPEELDFDHFPVTASMPGIPVWAWIRFPDSAELVKAETSTWSAKAVQVRWEDAGIRRSTWVWASAVSRRSAEGRRSTLANRTPAGKGKN